MCCKITGIHWLIVHSEAHRLYVIHCTISPYTCYNCTFVTYMMAEAVLDTELPHTLPDCTITPYTQHDCTIWYWTVWRGNLHRIKECPIHTVWLYNRIFITGSGYIVTFLHTPAMIVLIDPYDLYDGNINTVQDSPVHCLIVQADPYLHPIGPVHQNIVLLRRAHTWHCQREQHFTVYWGPVFRVTVYCKISPYMELCIGSIL